MREKGALINCIRPKTRGMSPSVFPKGKTMKKVWILFLLPMQALLADLPSMTHLELDVSIDSEEFDRGALSLFETELQDYDEVSWSFDEIESTQIQSYLEEKDFVHEFDFDNVFLYDVQTVGGEEVLTPSREVIQRSAPHLFGRSRILLNNPNKFAK